MKAALVLNLTSSQDIRREVWQAGSFASDTHGTVDEKYKTN